MPFKNENLAVGLRKDDSFKSGRSDFDAGEAIEQGVLLPWPSNPLASWVYYDCQIECMLDSGIVVHNRLPQINPTPDSLASCLFSDSRLDSLQGGVNIASRDQYADIVQRMGHSRYWFRLFGQALRVGQKIPIPGITQIGGVPAIPYDKNPQWAFNRIAPGNFAGVILWHAAWSLWYTTAEPPRNNSIPAADAAGHIADNGRQIGTEGIAAPFADVDDNSVKATLRTKLPPNK